MFILFLNNLIVLVCNFCFSNSPSNKANIFLGLIEYELNSLLGASHLVDYISIHIRFDLERYLLNITGCRGKIYCTNQLATLRDYSGFGIYFLPTAGDIQQISFEVESNMN